MNKNKMPGFGLMWILLPLGLLLAALLVVSAAMFAQALQYDRSRAWGEGTLNSVELEGVYSEEGGLWKPLTKDTDFDYRELRDITVRGHFTKDIPAGEKLFFNICQLWVTLRVNGEEAFSFGPRDGDGNPAQSNGNMWFTYNSPGINAADEVELRFGNLYRNAYFIQFDNLLWHMYSGSEQALVSQTVRKDAGLLLLGGVFLVLTLFLLIASILLAILKIHGAMQFFWLGLCTLYSAAWFATLAPALSLFLPFPVFLNAVYSYSMQGIAASIIMFVSANLSGWRKKAMLCAFGALMAVMLFAMWQHMAGISDLFSAIEYFSVLDLALVLLLVYSFVVEIKITKNKNLIQFLKATLPLVVLGVLELINGFVQFAEAGICFGAGLFLFAVLEGFFVLRRVRQSIENEKRALELERELSQSRISIMLSQIQPHFLYNSLVGIKQLCDNDPQKASDALEHFSYYLRGNLDSLSNAGLIPFAKELNHVEDYLYLEKMRYEERLNINWEIECRDFMLPQLTLQPLVENAVRYGITKKKAGGNLTIRSEKTADTVVLTVLDDGAGFNIDEKKEDGRTHTGIENVRNRLETLCGGFLRVKSEKGVGTEVTIILPLRRGISDENDCG